MLSRIYGTAYDNKEDLKEHLKRMEEAREKDHNRLGREMELFTTVDVIGGGLPLILPKGTIMLQELQRWIEDLEDNEWGYIRTRLLSCLKMIYLKLQDTGITIKKECL